MIYGIAIDAFYGFRQRRAYVCDHEGDGFFPATPTEQRYILGFDKPNYPVPAIALVVVHAYEPDDGMHGDVHYVIIEDYTHNTGDFYWPDGDVQYNCEFH